MKNLDNIRIAKMLDNMSDILEVIDGNRFRIAANRRAARAIDNLDKDIIKIYKKDNLQSIPGVGKGIEKHIKEIIKTGKSKELNRLRKKIPKGVTNLMNIQGIGPQKAKLFYDKFNVKTIKGLKKLVKSHKLRKLKGWGEKSEKNILKSIKLYKKFQKRFILGAFYDMAISIKDKLKKSDLIEKVEICGSFRRGKETIGDLDFLITSNQPKKAIKFFTSMKEIDRVLLSGDTKARVVIKEGPQADLRVVDPKSFGAAMHYFTGSKDHNIHIRKLGMKKNLKINEYGIFKKSNNKRIGGKNETQVFKSIGLPYIPPEIREDKGEVEMAQKNKLPTLIKDQDIKGDLQMHSNWSDGNKTILEMAKACKKMGYKYLAITDHATPMGMINGLNKNNVNNYLKDIKKANKKIKGIKIFTGCEVDILENGDLFLPDKILQKFDIVLGAIHSGFKKEKTEQTQRLAKAMKNKHIDIIAHPTGRIINKREPINLNMEKIIKIAKKENVVLEINASWQRLDLKASYAKLAKENKVKLAISTDAHSPNSLKFMKFGVLTAKRGWIEKKDVINTKSLKSFEKFINKK